VSGVLSMKMFGEVAYRLLCQQPAFKSESGLLMRREVGLCLGDA